MNETPKQNSQVTPTPTKESSPLIGLGWGAFFTLIYFITFYITIILSFLTSQDLFNVLFFISWLILLIILYRVTKKLLTNFPTLASLIYIKKSVLLIFLGSAVLFLLFLIPSTIQNLTFVSLIIEITSILDLSFICVLAFIGILFLLDFSPNSSVTNEMNSLKFTNVIKYPFITGLVTGILYILTIISQLLFTTIQISGTSFDQILAPTLTLLGYIIPPIILYLLFRNKKIDLFHVTKSTFLVLNLFVIIVVETIIYFPTIVIASYFFPSSFSSSNLLVNITLSLPSSVFTLLGTLAGLYLLHNFK